MEAIEPLAWPLLKPQSRSASDERALRTATLRTLRMDPSATRRILGPIVDRALQDAIEDGGERDALRAAGCPEWLLARAAAHLNAVRHIRAHGPVRMQRQPDYVATPSQTPVGHPCRYCGAPANAFDHVWPRSRGGDDHPNNLVPACTPCNSAKAGHSWLTARCPRCDAFRDPGDVVTATGFAYYACRCGASWSIEWDLQHGVKWRKARPSGW